MIYAQPLLVLRVRKSQVGHLSLVAKCKVKVMELIEIMLYAVLKVKTFRGGIKKKKKSVVMNQHNDYYQSFVLFFCLCQNSNVSCSIYLSVLMLRERKNMKQLSVYLLTKRLQ